MRADYHLVKLLYNMPKQAYYYTFHKGCMSIWYKPLIHTTVGPFGLSEFNTIMHM